MWVLGKQAEELRKHAENWTHTAGWEGTPSLLTAFASYAGDWGKSMPATSKNKEIKGELDQGSLITTRVPGKGRI